MHDIAVLYCSCFMYRNLWQPFLQLRRKYLSDHPGLNLTWYIGTDGAEEDVLGIIGDEMKILSYPEPANNNTNYMKRLVSYLERIQGAKYVLFWYDDMFPTGAPDWEAFGAVVDMMNANTSIQLVKCSQHSWPFRGSQIAWGARSFHTASPTCDYIANVQIPLFRYDFLLEMCRWVEAVPRSQDGGSDFEIHGTAFAKRGFADGNMYLRSNSDIVPIFDGGGVVRGGIVTADALTFLERERLQMKMYDRNCIYDLNDSTNTRTLNRQLKYELSEWYKVHV